MIALFYRPCGTTPLEQHTAAYELLDAALSMLGYGRPAVAKTDRGKPYFPARPDLHCSITHTKGYAAVALGDVPCGIDLEHRRPLPRRVCERYLDGLEGEEALRRWTERESCGKLTGEGFLPADPTGERFAFRSFPVPEGCLLTVCFERGQPPPAPPVCL